MNWIALVKAIVATVITLVVIIYCTVEPEFIFILLAIGFVAAIIFIFYCMFS